MEHAENKPQTNIKQSARYKAVKLLSRYDRSDAYVDKLLKFELNNNIKDVREKALLTELVNGVIRWRLKLDWILIGFYHGEYQKCLNIIKNAMRVGLYQILFLDRIPDAAAINESVEIIKHIQGQKIAAVVNGVLRNILRNIENVRYPNPKDDMSYYFSIIYSHQKWMVKRWLTRFGTEETEKLLIKNNIRPMIPIRVNTMNSTREEIITIFDEHELEYTLLDHVDHSIMIKSPKFDIASTELFKTGKITVQDPSASFAARLAAPKENDLVYDLCAAPGGKSFLMAELMNGTGKVVAMDKYDSKLKQIQNGADRLGLTNIETLIGDATSSEFEELADVVFCDVPCSGFGTIAKKADIKWARDLEEVRSLAKMQYEILNHAATLVKIGGAVVYSTCTIEKEENGDIVTKFLAEHPEFELDRAGNYIPQKYTLDGMIQLFPHIHNTDGSFAARLVRKS